MRGRQEQLLQSAFELHKQAWPSGKALWANSLPDYAEPSVSTQFSLAGMSLLAAAVKVGNWLFDALAAFGADLDDLEPEPDEDETL